MSHHLWTKLLSNIANLGYVGVALPIAGILVVWLCTHRRWYTAAGCAAAVVGCSACIFLLKLAFFMGDLRLPALGLQNPSGHSAVGAVVYGSLAWIVSREIPGWPGRALLLLTCAGVAAIGASLYVIGSHTLPDVLAGLTLGGTCAVAFALFGFHDGTPTGRFPAGLMLVVAITIMSLQGLHLVPHFEPSNLLLLVPSMMAPA
jgi:membrane-associated phospholipid phosphatase